MTPSGEKTALTFEFKPVITEMARQSTQIQSSNKSIIKFTLYDEGNY